MKVNLPKAKKPTKKSLKQIEDFEKNSYKFAQRVLRSYGIKI